MSRLTNQDRILRYAEKKKLIRPMDLANIKGARTLISRLVDEGKLVRVGRGLYSPANAEFDEKQNLAEIAKVAPNAVICLLSALRFHDLTTQNPFEIWIAIEGMSRRPSVEFVPLRVLRFSGPSFTAGIDMHKIDGGSVKVYNPAKTIADCFKYRNKIGLDVAMEALRDGWSQKKVTMDELWHYAKVCRVSNVIRPYLESLL
ncbi:MAG: type IV toxin-antitoxin system AbiEi family antitoxin domain-containing protein [Pyrinomonadaceae bacterium]